MSFNVTIQNIGKLKHADIRIGQFTVLAGPNNTGKSTVSKLLYSVFDGMNVNHAMTHFYNLTQLIRAATASLVWWPHEDEPHPLAFIDETLMKMEGLILGIPTDNIEQIEAILPAMRTSAAVLCERFMEKQAVIEAAWEQSDQDSKSYIKSACQRLEENLHSLCRNLEDETGSTFVIGGLREKIQENLVRNFQVPDLSSIQGNHPIPGKISIDGVATFRLTNEQSLVHELAFSGMARLQRYSRVLYLEAPSYWKFKLAFEAIKDYPRFFYHPRRTRLSGVPEYIYDSFRAIHEKYTGEVPFGHIAEKLTSEQVMNGKLALSEHGEVQFHENDRIFPLSMTAMGVVNLGMLALLMECRVLDEGTFLFIDEPESNLHPEWQHIMAETLFELSRHGVHVVIATHSLDILKWVEIHLKNNPNDKNLVAMNCFPPCADGDKSLDMKLANAKKSLSQSFLDRHLEGI